MRGWTRCSMWRSGGFNTDSEEGGRRMERQCHPKLVTIRRRLASPPHKDDDLPVECYVFFFFFQNSGSSRLIWYMEFILDLITWDFLDSEGESSGD